jgi:hypothetical protein
MDTDKPLRTVLIEPSWKMRQEFTHLIRHPPEGYRFIQNPTGAGRGGRGKACRPMPLGRPSLHHNRADENCEKRYKALTKAPMST